MKAGIKFGLWIALSSSLGLLSTAQQTPAPANADAPAQTQPASADKNKPDSSAQQPANQPNDPDKKSSIQETGNGKVAGTSSDRLFYAMPNFLTLQGREKLPPLSSKDKFKVVALGTFDYFEYPWWGVLAAISQAQNNEPGYGQGWAGYGKRYGSTAGDSMIENFMVGAVFPSVLHQDPRFYQSEGGGFFKRSGYAVSRIFVTRGDSGKSQFNYSEIFGSAIAAGISTYSYHPRSTFVSTPTNPHLFVASDRTFSNTLSTWETQLALDTITIAVKEFWPDIHRKLSHKSKDASPVGSDPH
jgi:hypothetical protein